jgi:acyl-[acyl-carrier-protein] desaturase
MREAGVDRNVFIQKVYMPILKYLGVNRHEMLAAQRTALDLRRGGERRDPSIEGLASAPNLDNTAPQALSA